VPASGSPESTPRGPSTRSDGDSQEDDLVALLAPTGVPFGPPPREVPSSTASDRATEETTPTPEQQRSPAPDTPPAAQARGAALPSPAPGAAPPARLMAEGAAERPAPSPAPTRPASGSGDWFAVGRWYQPVPGGRLPRPSPLEPLMAAFAVDPGTPVHAVTAGQVRRAAAQADAHALELHAADGSVFVYTGPATVAWVADEEEVAPGALLGVVADDGAAAGGRALWMLAISPDGGPRDAVALLVGLPDPGEIDLDLARGGLGIDPFRLDLEIARELAAGAT
jgi:hypothetical protein